MRAASAKSIGPCCRRVAWLSTRTLGPSMYSMAMKYWPLASPKSKIWTRLGWLSSAASRASPRNISMKRGSSLKCGRMRFTTHFLAKPIGPSARARKTSAMPPVASFLTSVYLPSFVVTVAGG